MPLFENFHRIVINCFCKCVDDMVILFRISLRRCSIKKRPFENFAKFAGKQLYWSLFFNKVTGLRPRTLLKKRLQHRYFSVNFAKFLRTFFHRTRPGNCFCLLWFPVWFWYDISNIWCVIVIFTGLIFFFKLKKPLSFIFVSTFFNKVLSDTWKWFFVNQYPENIAHGKL